MNSLRNLIALLVLASITLALAQNTLIKVMVSFAPGVPIDMTIRDMGKNLQASSGRGFLVTHVVGEFGASADPRGNGRWAGEVKKRYAGRAAIEL